MHVEMHYFATEVHFFRPLRCTE